MSILLLIVMGMALLAAGAGATFMLGSSIPQHLLQHAQEHGRFTGLAGLAGEKRTGKKRPARASPKQAVARPHRA
jgi:hypothetical protein